MSRSSLISIILFIAFTFLFACNNINKQVIANSKEEIATIDHSLLGCFGSEENKLVLYKESGSTFAKLETNGKLVQNRKISSMQMEAFHSFVNELSKLKEIGWCTTVEDYVLHTASGIIKRTDGGCRWNGFATLEKELFVSEDK